MEALINCSTLINIEGTVYRLTKRDYQHFRKTMNEVGTGGFKEVDSNAWSELLHWVEDHGVKICNVETYNF